MENHETGGCDRRSCVLDRVPTLSKRHPWLVTHNLDEEEEAKYQIFCTIPEAADHYHCQIPELVGREIQACFHGWVILTKYPDQIEWSLWNPVTSNFMCLPPLTIQPKADTCIWASCLSSPPPDPASVLLLLRTSSIMFCHLHKRRRRRRWREMSYKKQLRIINDGHDDDIISNLIYCNGKVYVTTALGNVLLLDIVVTNNNVFIRLLPFVKLPNPPTHHRYAVFVKEYNAQLLVIFWCYKGDKLEWREFRELYMFKLDMVTSRWEPVQNAKDHVFFLDLGETHSINYSPAIAIQSESGGGYIHIFDRLTRVCSYNIQDKTISLTPPPCLELDLPQIPGTFRTIYNSVWVMPTPTPMLELEFDGQKADSNQVLGREQEEEEGSVIINQVQQQKSLLDLPFHILQLIAEHCLAVEYLNFRATCKLCCLAAPHIQWSAQTTTLFQHCYSLVSPWLMMLDKDRGIITFTDPLSGDKFFMNTFPGSIIGQAIICSSRYGWLLIFSGSHSLVFFNPFTRATRSLPPVPAHESHFSSIGFSAPPTSPDCVVVGFMQPSNGYGFRAIITSPGNPEWHRIYNVPDDPSVYYWPTFCGRDLYVYDSKKSGPGILREFGRDDCSWDSSLAQLKNVGYFRYTWPPFFASRPFLVECNDDLLLIIVGDLGETVQVLKLNLSTLMWDVVRDLGRHMIYVSETTCFSVVAKTQEMENKIYFPMFHARNRNMVFYSLDTCKYHTFKGGDKNKQEETLTDFFSVKKQMMGVWIQPSWSS